MVPRVFNCALITGAYHKITRGEGAGFAAALVGLRRIVQICDRVFNGYDSTVAATWRFVRRGRLKAKQWERGQYGAKLVTVGFLIPAVVAIEGTRGKATVRRCAELLRERWGDDLADNLPSMTLTLLLSVPAWLYASVFATMDRFHAFDNPAWAVGAVAALVWLVAVPIFATAWSGYRRAAIYYYAVHGTAPPNGVYTAEDLSRAYNTRVENRA